MKQKLLILFYFFSIMVLNYTSYGQECGVPKLNKNAKNSLQNETDYTDYLNKIEKIKGAKSARSIVLGRTEDNAWGLCNASTRVLKIPVVFHIIHEGEAVGVGFNRSDAWVNTFLDSLNYRYRNQGNVMEALDIQIEFYLAKRGPTGNATTGINRVNGTTAYPDYPTVGYPESDVNGNLLRDLSRWPKERYLNIWIVNKFESNIGGFGNYPDDDDYNGTVITSNYTPLIVHEMGHVFNLIHTFEGDNGDNGTNPILVCPPDNSCLVDGDKVCDTRPHKRNDCLNSACPAGAGTVGIANWNNTLYNYMSYYYSVPPCDPVLPTLFTLGQKNRIRAAALGQFRGRLLISDALIPVNNIVEAGIKQIKAGCSPTFSPSLVLKNYGTSSINNATIQCLIDGVLVQTYNYVGNIASNASATITLNAVSVSTALHSIEMRWTNINGTLTDTFQEDNTYCGSFSTESFTTNPVVENFEAQTTLPAYVEVAGKLKPNVDVFNSANCVSRGTKLLRINSFEASFSQSSPDSTKTTTIELAKNLDLTNASAASLSFYVATRKTYFCDNWKSLKAFVSTDCGITWTNIYHKNDKDCSGPETATVLPLWTVTSPSVEPTSAYIPTNCSEWRQETIDLTPYINNNVKIKFVHYGYRGNPDNVYLDDINLSKTVAVAAVCVKAPNLGVPEAYNKTTNPYPIAITSQVTKQNNWLENIPNAFLVLESKEKGFVITRMNTAQRNLLSPVKGMLIYNTDTSANCFQLYNGTTWKCIEKSCNE